MGLSSGERISKIISYVFWHNTGVSRTDGEREMGLLQKLQISLVAFRVNVDIPSSSLQIQIFVIVLLSTMKELIKFG